MRLFFSAFDLLIKDIKGYDRGFSALTRLLLHLVRPFRDFLTLRITDYLCTSVAL